MAERISLSSSWQNSFEKMSLQDSEPITLSREATSENDHHFQHRLSQQDNKGTRDSFYSSFESPITLRYRDSISSNASSLSRNSTVSSTDTRYFSAKGTPSELNTPTATPIRVQSWSSNNNDHFSNMPAPMTISTRFDRPNSISPVQQQFSSHQPPYIPTVEPYLPQRSAGYYSIVEPNGCFVPTQPLSFIQKTDVTKHHYVIPTFAMAGQIQADVMKLIFNYTDSQPFAPKEEYERTIPWHVDRNSSLITLSQYTSLGKDNPVSRNYLLGLGQRLGITTILVIVSIEVIDTVYPLLNSLVKAMELATDASELSEQDQPSWWKRVVLVINQQHGVSDQIAYAQRKSVLIDQMPRIQERYQLSHPLSTLFISTQVYDQIKNTEQGVQYKTSCQRILWQMMDKHMLSGRWCSELLTLQNRMNSGKNNNGTLNILNDEEDDSSSSSDDVLFRTVIDIKDGKVTKPSKKKKKKPQQNSSTTTSTTTGKSQLQRRNTRRQIQKLHCHDGDDGTALPLPFRHN